MRIFVVVLALLSASPALLLQPPQDQSKRVPIEDAVFAYFTTRNRSSGPGLIFAVWSDSQAIWSSDRLDGGPPYLTGKVDKKALDAAVSTVETDGYFDDASLKQLRFGPDAATTVLMARSGKRDLKMESWHELYESNGKVVATDHGLQGRGAKTKLAVLKDQPAAYLLYRLAWSDLRNHILSLTPTTGQPTTGKLAYDAGKVYWYPQAKD